MTLGQVLAMIAKGEQPSRNMAPQAQASIPLPWSQIATAPEPEPGYITKQPVEVTATRLPALPETMDPLSMYEAELYGGPVTQQESVGTAQTPMPMANYGFMPTQQPTMAKLPPLPIQGYTPVQQPEITTRAPRALTDVPQEEPMAMPTGQDIAMVSPMAQPQMPATPTAEDAKAEEERKKQEAAQLWRPTDDFTVTYKDKTYTIPGGTFKIGQQATVTLPSGRIANLQQSDNPELYNAISTEFQNRIQAAQPPEQDKDFSSQIFVEDEGWVRAKVEPSTGTVYYKDKEGSIWRYPTPLDLKVNENYRGPAREDQAPSADLEALQVNLRNPFTPYFDRLGKTSEPFKRVAASSEVMNRIKPVWGKQVAEGYGIFPQLNWVYEAGEGGQQYQISLDDAIAKGLVSPSVRTSLDQVASSEIKSIEDSADQFGRMMGTKAPSMRQEDLNRINAAIAENEDQKKKVTSPKELAALQKESIKLQKTKNEILSRLTTSVQAGGVTITEAPQAERGTSLDPKNPLDALAIARAGATIEPGVGASPRFTLEDLGEDIKSKALSGFEQAEISPSGKYSSAISVLSAKLNQIQLDANENEQFADNPSRVLDTPAQFRWYDAAAGSWSPITTMPIRSVLENYTKASENLRKAVAQAGIVEGGQEILNQVRKDFYNAALPLSGSVTIPGLSTYNLSPSLTEGDVFSTSGPKISLRTQQISTVNPMMLEAKPAPADTTAPRARGREEEEKPKVDAFPLFQMGNDKKSYMRWDSGFNPFQVMVASPEAFDFQALRNSTGQAATSVDQNLANSIFDEDGIFTPEQKQAASKFTDEYNKKIAGPEGKDARRAIANAFYDSMATLGFMAKIPVADFIGDLEKIYDGKMSMTEFRNKYASDAALAEYFAKSAAGVETLNAPDGSDYKGVVNVAGTGKTSKLYEQGKLAIEQIGYLFKNSGAGGAEHETNSGAKVKWVINPFRPGYLAGSEFSVLSVPASTNVDQNALIQDAKQAAPDLGKPKSLPASGLIDISGTYAMNNIAKILGKGTTISPLFDLGFKTNTSVGGAMTNVAKSNFPADGNLFIKNDQVRKPNEERTKITEDTNESVVKGVTYTILMHSLFPERRFRKP